MGCTGSFRRTTCFFLPIHLRAVSLHLRGSSRHRLDMGSRIFHYTGTVFGGAGHQYCSHLPINKNGLCAVQAGGTGNVGTVRAQLYGWHYRQ